MGNKRKSTINLFPYYLIENNIELLGTFISRFFFLDIVFYIAMIILYIQFCTLFSFTLLLISFLCHWKLHKYNLKWAFTVCLIYRYRDRDIDWYIERVSFFLKKRDLKSTRHVPFKGTLCGSCFPSVYMDYAYNRT